MCQGRFFPILASAIALLASPSVSQVLKLHIVDPDYNGGVEKIPVEIYIDDDQYTDYTDTDGKVVIKLPEEGVHYGIRVTAKPERYLPTTVTWKRAELDNLPEEYTLTLAKGSTIGGTIEEENGKPIAHVKVIMSIFPVPGGEERTVITDHEERTDDRGDWRCQIAPKNIQSVRLRLEHPYYITNQYYDYGPGKDRNIGDLKTYEDKIVLRKSLSLEGIVLDEKGRGLQGARVSTGQGAWEKGRKPTAIADAAGKFRFKDVEPGEMTLSVQAEGYAHASQIVQITEAMEPVRFHLEPGASIKGHVVDKEGNPIPQVSVSSEDGRSSDTNWQGFTDTEGRFEWTSAPYRKVNFSFYKADYQRLSKDLEPSEEEQEIVLASPLVVSGTVEDAETGEPVPSFQVVAGVGWGPPDQQPQQPVHWDRRNAQSGSDGRYEVSFPQSYPQHLVRIEAVGYLPAISRAFTDDEGRQTFNFGLKKGTDVKGKVVSSEGTPVSDVDVILCTPGNALSIQNGEWRNSYEALSVKSDRDGAFSFSPQEEPFLVVAMADQGYAEVTGEDLKFNQRVPLIPWGSVAGVLKIGSATGAGETITLWRNESYQRGLTQVHFDYRTTTSDEGKFRFSRVVPGEVTVARQVVLQEFQGRAFSTTQANSTAVTVDPGKTTQVQIGGNGRTVTGRLVFPATAEEKVPFGNGYQNLSTKVDFPYSIEEIKSMTPEQIQKAQKEWLESPKYKEFLKDPRNYGFKIEPEGSFHIEDVVSGTYTLSIQVRKPREGLPFQPGAEDLIGTVNREVIVPGTAELPLETPLDLGEIPISLQKDIDHPNKAKVDAIKD